MCLGFFVESVKRNMFLVIFFPCLNIEKHSKPVIFFIWLSSQQNLFFSFAQECLD